MSPDGYSENIKSILPEAVDMYRNLVDNFEEVSLKQVGRARKQIQALVGGEIVLHPTQAGHLEAELSGDYAGLRLRQNDGDAYLPTGV